VALVNGVNLGINNSAASSVARILLTTAPTLVGTTAASGSGINAAVHNTQIVPYLLGEAASSSGGTGTASGTPDTFVTYDPTTGLRPLNPIDEFTNVTVNNFVAGDNTRIGAVSQTLPSSMALNSLILGGGTLAVGSNTLTLSSGALLFTASSSITGGTLALGGVEGVFSALPGTSQISSKITGTAGVTLNGINGGLIAFGSNQSDYTGNTTLLAGTFVPQTSSIGPGGAPTSGPLGKSTLVLAGGAIRGTSVSAVTVANNVVWQADTAVPTGGMDLTFTGGVTITNGSHTLSASTSANTIFSGAVTDGGSNFGLTVNNTAGGSVVFNGANTYGGATTVSKGILVINGTHTGGDTYTVASTATLAGAGSISTKTNSSVTINSGGTLSVGSTSTVAGTLTITTSGSGALTFASPTSVLKMDLVSDASAGTGTDQSADPTRADKLAITGSAVLNGAHFIFSDPNSIGTSLSEGDRFDLFDWATALPVGNFTINPATDLPLLASGLSWDLSDLYTGGTIAVAPEPSRALLMAFALTALGLRRRRMAAVIFD
jgi:autotransporter-associated beta strand protein